MNNLNTNLNIPNPYPIINREMNKVIDYQKKVENPSSPFQSSLSKAKKGNGRNEILNIHIVNSGCMIGLEFWKKMIEEKELINKEQNKQNLYLNTLFDDFKSQNYSPRAIFIDYNENVMEHFDRLNYHKLLKSDNFCMVDKYQNKSDIKLEDLEIILSEKIKDKIRIHMEKCNSLQGLIGIYSASGNAGCRI